METNQIKMKIAYLTREYPPDTLWGGEAVVCYNLARALAQRGHEVHVICQAVGKPKDVVEEAVFVHRVGTNWRRYSALARINYMFYAWRKLKEMLKNCGVELVDAPYWSAEGFLSLGKQIPLIVRTQSFPRDAIRTKNYAGISQLLSLKILSLLADFVVKRADKIIANSKSNYHRVVKELPIRRDKVEIIHLSIDTDRFRPVTENFRGKIGISSGVPIVLSIGRLEMRKGFHVLIQAIPEIIKTIPPTMFVLVGRDTNTAPGGSSFRCYLLERARGDNAQGKLIFIDSLAEHELIQLYSACDAFVFPSLHESFGLPVLEAMACGKPVVATDTGVAPELGLDGSGGVLVPINNVKALAAGIIHCLSLTPTQKEWVAVQNRKKVEQEFSIGQGVEKWEAIYRQVKNQWVSARGR